MTLCAPTEKKVKNDKIKTKRQQNKNQNLSRFGFSRTREWNKTKKKVCASFFLPILQTQRMYNLKLTSSVLKMEGRYTLLYKGEKKQQKQKKNMHKHYAKHIEINSHFMLK